MVRFSLLTVCLNPGEKLRKTVESALGQTFQDFELIIKDGTSRDGSLDTIADYRSDPRVKVFVEKDTGIYDGMNQAVSHATGKYVFFLNCGDLLYDAEVLARIAEADDALSGGKPVQGGAAGDTGADGTRADIAAAHAGADGAKANSAAAEAGTDGTRANIVAVGHGKGEHGEATGKANRWILYGNVYSAKTKAWITPPPQITGFTCYRNIPCHQACFYDAGLCREKPFETKYKIRGDYEHFLWCFYRGKAGMHYVDTPVAEYEGGGYSETKENLKRSQKEHREITALYMGKAELFRYRFILAVTLAPLRTMIAENPKLSGIYQKLVKTLYRR